MKKDAYIERVLDGYSLTEFSPEEREKIKQLTITVRYNKRRYDWFGLFVFTALFFFAFYKNLIEGYTFGNGVIFGFTLVGIFINSLPLLQNAESVAKNFEQRQLLKEAKILEKYEIIEETETKETQENDSNGEDTVYERKD
ncbi:MAG: hypothetical protein ACW990_00185 [Promethearchaeota archaeon]